jgi:hypothetical protein
MNDKLTPKAQSAESLLGRYRPVGPPGDLRGRIAASINAPRRRGPVLWWASLAAMIVVSICLIAASQADARQTAAMLNGRTSPWTPQMQETIEWLEQQQISSEYFVWLWRLEQIRTPNRSLDNLLLTNGDNIL